MAESRFSNHKKMVRIQENLLIKYPRKSRESESF